MIGERVEWKSAGRTFWPSVVFVRAIAELNSDSADKAVQSISEALTYFSRFWSKTVDEGHVASHFGWHYACSLALAGSTNWKHIFDKCTRPLPPAGLLMEFQQDVSLLTSTVVSILETAYRRSDDTVRVAAEVRTTVGALRDAIEHIRA